MGVVETRTPRETRSFAALVRDLAVSAAGLLRGELRLLRMEAATLGTRAARGTAQVALGAILLLLGVLAFATGIVLLAGDQWLPDDRYWLAAFVILVITGALAAWLARMGLARLHPSRLAPDETIETLREDSEWLKRRMTSAATSK